MRLFGNKKEEKHLQNFPVCIRPWLHFGLGWNTYSTCCAAFKYDFGNIAETPDDVNVLKDIFNSENYIMMRTKLISGELPDVCVNCSQKYGVGSFSQLQKTLIDIAMQIEDIDQRQRALDNYYQAIQAIVDKKVVVEHMPVLAVITAGSGCNIECKFCYNCHMDYHPEADTILRILDKIHDKLIYAQVTGGEPLVTKAGRAILKEFTKGKYKFAVRLGTNAQWTDFDLLKPVNLADVQISTDGATKEVYEQVRIGGNFEDLIENIKKFIELKKEKPLLKISTNYTVTSDNYIDIPAACKLYEQLGTFTMFGLVMREKDDPQNIKERPDLYDDFLLKIDEGLAIASSPFTKEKLLVMKNVILSKKKEYLRK